MSKSAFLLRILAVATIGAALSGAVAFAQMPTGSPAGVDATLAQLFGNIAAFSAQANVRVLDKDQQETMTTPMAFAFRDQKVRVDIDLSKLKSKQVSTAAAQQLKQMGMEQVTSIIRPDKKQMYIVYPALQSCVTMPLPKEEVAAIDKPPKVAKAELARETLDGHPCIKTKVTLTDDKGQTRDAVTWNASDLKEFPVQIQTAEKDNTLIMRFSQVKFDKPDAQQFEPPTGYTQYADMQEMMMGVMKKMLSGAGGK